MGWVRFGANAWNLDKSDLHPGPDVLQGHRCIAERDDGQWNEQLGASGSSAGGSSSGGAGAPPSIPNAPYGNGFPMDAWLTATEWQSGTCAVRDPRPYRSS